MRNSGQYKTIRREHEEDIVEIGQRIKKVRKTLRRSQKEMADQMHMSPSYLSEIESGKANPGPEFFLKFINLYNASLEYLYHGKGEMFYSSKRKVAPDEYSFDDEIDTIEKLVWLMENSSLVKNTILAYASKFVLGNEQVVKKSINKVKKKKSKKSQ